MKGQDIRIIRQAWELRQGDMALLLGVTASHLSRIETSALRVSMVVGQIVDLLVLLADATPKHRRLDAQTGNDGAELRETLRYARTLMALRQDTRQMLILLRLIERSALYRVKGLSVAQASAQETV